MKAIALIFAFLFASDLFAADKLVIISPHRKSIQDEYIPEFKKYYKDQYKTDVEVDWLDQGGTSDDIRFVRAKFASNKTTSGIDIFWGGGTTTFLDLKADGILAPFELPKDLKSEVPETASGIPLYDKSRTWYASAMSSFGIFYNKKIVQFDKLPSPEKWQDLADPKFQGQLSLTDPRRSGSASIMNAIVMQSMGWDKGWELLTKIGANVAKFSHSSSDPIKAVVAGDAAAAMAIDFYANAKIGDIGAQNLGFAIPAGQTVLDSDPVGILKGAPNRKVAERFVTWLLGADAQKILILPKGVAQGPKFSTLGRVAVNQKAYNQTEGKRTNEFNPFKGASFMDLDLDKASKMQRVFNDLVGAMMVDTHRELKEAWKAVLKRGAKPDEVAELGKSPVTEKEVLALNDKWDDNVFRTKKINEWTDYAKAKYKKLASK